MSGPRVLLMTLAERTSAKGTVYLAGWLGKARLVGFRATEPDKYGNEVWKVYAQEPEPKADSDQSPTRNAERGNAGWDRARDQKAAQRAGTALLAAAGTTSRRREDPEPPADWLDDSAEAIRDLEGRR